LRKHRRERGKARYIGEGREDKSIELLFREGVVVIIKLIAMTEFRE
jgi:hypothetical protein